jgi:hypothetical protein
VPCTRQIVNIFIKRPIEYCAVQFQFLYCDMEMLATAARPVQLRRNTLHCNAFNHTIAAIFGLKSTASCHLC